MASGRETGRWPVCERSGQAVRGRLVVLHAYVALAVGAVHVLVSEPEVTLIAGGLGVFATYLYIALREARLATLWLSPLSYYFFWYSIGLGLSAVYVGWITSLDGSIPFSVVRVGISDLAAAYVVFLIGSVALHAGMATRGARRAGREYTEDIVRCPMRLIVISWAVGVLANACMWVFSFLGSGLGVVMRLSVSAVCAVAITPRAKLGVTPVVHVVVLAVGIASEIAVRIATLSKAEIMLCFFPLVWLAVLRPEARKLRGPLALSLVCVYVFAVAPSVAWLRNRPLEDRTQARSTLINGWCGGEVSSSLEEDPLGLAANADHLLRRLFPSTPLGWILKDVRAHGYQLGGTMEYAKWAFIPRVLLPEKPRVSRGAWFTAHLGFSKSEEEATTSTGITATGEWYWNFGLPGVIVGMYLTGLLLGQLWRMAGDDPRTQPMHFLLYSMVMLNMPTLEGEAIAPISGAVCSYILFRFGFFYFDPKAQRADRASRSLTPRPVG